MAEQLEMCRQKDGLIEPSQIPGLAMQPSTIDTAALAFTNAAAGVRLQGATLVTRWSGLSAVYSAPESEQLLGVMAPVGVDTGVLSDTVTSIGGHLTTLAETVLPIQQELTSIRDRAVIFVEKALQGKTVDYWDPNHPAWDDGWVMGFLKKDFSEMVPAHIAWDKYQPWIDKNNGLITEVNVQFALLEEARTTCINAINGLRPESSICVAVAQPLTAEQLNEVGVELPWGTQGNGDRSQYEKFNDGIGSAVEGAYTGTLTLFSFNPETGEWGDKRSAWNAWLDMGSSLGAIILLSPHMLLLDNYAPKGSGLQVFADKITDRQVDIAFGLVGSPQDWQENPAKTAGSTFVNVGSFFIPGAGVAGAAAKSGMFGARAASLFEHAALALGKGGNAVLDAANSINVKVGDALTGLVEKLKGGNVGGVGTGARMDEILSDTRDRLKYVDFDVNKPHGPAVDAGPDANGAAPTGAPDGAPASGVPDVTDGSKAPAVPENVPPHTGLAEPPRGAGAETPAMPDLSDLDAKYRDQDGHIRVSELENWATEVAERYPVLTKEDVLGAHYYTTSAYEDMNNYLRGTPYPYSSAALEQRIEAASAAIAKLPPEPGVTYRGVREVPGYADSFTVGKTWSDPAFTSSSTKRSTAEGFGGVFIRLEGKTGVDISQLSSYKRETEIIFQRNTEWEVVSKTYDKANERWEISLKETGQ